MLKNRLESIIAIVGILFVGILSTLGILDQSVGKVIAIVIFAMSEVMTCFNMQKRNGPWKKEALLGSALIILILVLLF